MSDKLPDFAACPWCGKSEHAPSLFTAELFGLPYHGVEGNLSVAYDSFGWAWVQCLDCIANGPKVKAPRSRKDNDKLRASMVNAVNAWNKRAEPTLFDAQPTFERLNEKGEKKWHR